MEISSIKSTEGAKVLQRPYWPYSVTRFLTKTLTTNFIFDDTTGLLLRLTARQTQVNYAHVIYYSSNFDIDSRFAFFIAVLFLCESERNSIKQCPK